MKKNIFSPFSRGICVLPLLFSHATAAPESDGIAFPSGKISPAAAAVFPGYLKPSNPEVSGHFGTSSALSGNTLVVGAPGETGTPGLEGSGAIYVFIKSGNAWVQQAHFKGPDPHMFDSFGSSVAISGDTLVVGAPYQNGVNPEPWIDLSYGAAYVYTRSGAVWTYQTTLRASNADQGDMFGSSVAISGNDILIGAPYANGSGATETPPFNAEDFSDGAAYVFTRSAANQWLQQADLKAVGHPGNEYDTTIGRSVAISGDTLVSDGHVFVRTSGAWQHQANLRPQTDDYRSGYGASVALAGETIIVGAPNELDANSKSFQSPGAAHVYQRNGTQWSQTALLKPFNGNGEDQFGGALAISGDLIVVGAQNEWGDGKGLNPIPNDESNYAGAAYTFVRKDQTWIPHTYLKASNTDEEDYFGASVAIDGDNIAIGASGEAGGNKGWNPLSNEKRSGAGAAYLFPISQLRKIKLAPEITIVGPTGSHMTKNSTFKLGNQAQGTISNSKTFQIENTGLTSLKLAGIKITGAQASDFTIENYRYIPQYHAPLFPGAKIAVEITFRPKALGLRKAVLTIKSDDSDEAKFQVKLQGTGTKRIPRK